MNKNTTALTIVDVKLAWYSATATPAQARFFRSIQMRPSLCESWFRYWTWKTWNDAREGKPLPPFREFR